MLSRITEAARITPDSGMGRCRIRGNSSHTGARWLVPTRMRTLRPGQLAAKAAFRTRPGRTLHRVDLQPGIPAIDRSHGQPILKTHGDLAGSIPSMESKVAALFLHPFARSLIGSDHVIVVAPVQAGLGLGQLNRRTALHLKLVKSLLLLRGQASAASPILPLHRFP